MQYVLRKKNGSERGNAGIIRKVNRLDNWHMHPLDGLRSQHDRYLQTMQRWLLFAKSVGKLELNAKLGNEKLYLMIVHFGRLETRTIPLTRLYLIQINGITQIWDHAECTITKYRFSCLNLALKIQFRRKVGK
jgi:hypothetical protein